MKYLTVFVKIQKTPCKTPIFTLTLQLNQMNYTLRQLQIFVKIVQTGSITQTADNLHLSQPAVSIQLKNFQQQFDFPLTETIGRKLFITSFGREIAEAAERILHEATSIDHKVKAFKGQLFGKLKISSVSTGKYIIPYYVSSFIKKHPGIELEIDVTNKSQVLESLETNRTDFALVSILPEKIPVETIELMENELHLVGSSSCGFTKKSYSKAILGEIPLLFREKGSGTRQMMESFLEQNSIKTLQKMELTTNEAVKQAVIADLGYSIMPYIGIKNEIKLGLLKLIPVTGLPIRTKWNIVYHSSKKLSTVAKAFEEHLREKKDAIQASFLAD
jgi:DNA-binding transcriptional LysR family regulator